MNINFESAKQVVRRENMVIDGVVVGWIEFKEPGSQYYHRGAEWHCGFNLPGRISLIQGFGATPDEAINNAIAKAKEDAYRLLSDIAALENRLSQ